MKLSRDLLLHKLGGYYLIPHELLHVLAYRLIGKPCHYQWGDWQVKSLARKTRRESLFTALFPFITCWGLGFFFGLLWILSAFFIKIPPERYLIDGPTWHVVFLMASALFLLYSHTSWKDLLKVHYWLFRQKTETNSYNPHESPDEQQIRRDKP